MQTFREEERLESLALLQGGFQPHAGGAHGDFLGVGEDGFDVQLVGSLAVLLHLGQDKALVELRELVLVGVLVDGFLVDEGFQELVFPALQLDDLSFGGGSLGRYVLPLLFPDVEDDPSKEGQELGARPELLQEAEELGLKLVPRHVRAAAVGFGRAVIVGVAPAVAALGPGAGERLVAVAAGEEAPQREVRVVALLGDDQAIGAQEALALPEDVFVDQGRPVADRVDAPGGLVDAADVEPVREHLAPLLLGQLAAPQGAEAVGGHDFQDLRSGVETRGVALEPEAHERCPLGVELHGLAVRQVAQGRPPDPLAAAQGFLHAGFRPAAADFVVELREGGEDAFHELAGGGLVDGLADGAEGDSEPGEVPADDGVVEGVAGEAVDVGDDKGVDLDRALVLLPEIGQGGL